ncbi:MAG: response regulator transcription factor [Pseudomonadales bacterium]|nr:response regulator transcription factor [Pseudomonadales bacterium]
MIKVIMADDHPLVRAGLKHLLADCPDMEFAAEVDNGNDLIAELRNQSYDVVLLDMIMPGRSGIELIKQLKSEHAKLPIIVISTHKEDMFAVRALKAGAAGYICKDYAASNLVEAIRKVAHGGLYISATVAELMAQELHSPSKDLAPHSLLSDREYQVFLLVAEGKGTNDIADQLNVSAKTISTHKARIKDKMKLSNDSDFVHYALKNGLITDM